MKKIGRQTLFLTTSEHNPRNGESTFLRLNDGRIMLAFTEYYGEEWFDHAIARICACYSSDEGETWTKPVIIIEKDAEAQNIMSPSLLRLPNGNLGIVYLRKEFVTEQKLLCMPVFSESADEGKSWSAPVFCTDEMGYYCVINDGCSVDRMGRIWVPMSNHGSGDDPTSDAGFAFQAYRNAVIQFACSDDCGKTWRKLPATIESPFGDDIGFAEPGLFEFADGRLWMYCRTPYGFQYQSFSDDRGESWSPVVPNFHFTSPDAPMRVKQVGDLTLAVFNPKGFSCVSTTWEAWRSPKRTPIVCAVSRDGGKSFDSKDQTSVDGGFDAFIDNCYLLEDDESSSYCYPAILETADGFLVTYYHSNGGEVCLNCTKVVKVLYGEL